MNPRRHLTYANVVSTVCLFLALGGVAYAGTKLAKGSVGSEQLKAEAVTKGKLHPNSVNSKKVVDGSLTGSDIDASTLGKVPNATNAAHAGTADSATSAGTATNADHANAAGTATDADHATSADSATSATDAGHATNADSATDADHATSADSATNADHATSADTATNADHAATATDAETIDGVSPDEFGPVLVASAEVEVTFTGEFFFSVSGIHAGGPSLPGLATILPSRKFQATDFAIHFEGPHQVGLSVHIYLVVDGVALSAEEVCTITEVPSTCTPSKTIALPAGAQLAWKAESLSPVTARPEFALRLLPG